MYLQSGQTRGSGRSVAALFHCSGFDRRKTVARVLRDSIGVAKRSLADLSDVELLGAVADGDQLALRTLKVRSDKDFDGIEVIPYYDGYDTPAHRRRTRSTQSESGGRRNLDARSSSPRRS